jgi:hypothetical protein
VLVPTNEISISQPSGTQRTLDFSHITWNDGAGPLEIDPHFNPSTGFSTATQVLSTRTGTAMWSPVKSIPIVKPMQWDPPFDYRFPLSGFGLYRNTASGTVGSLVVASPKVDFCMTPDTFVGGPADTTATGIPSPDDCDDPNGVLGLSVGWGDLYDHEDAGNNIDISNVPDGTYWLRAQADPGNYFAQSGPDQTVTDTQLKIRGTTVTVLQQVTPTITRPTVVVSSPSDGTSITGPTTVQAVAADNSAAISSQQLLVDGQPFGSPQTSEPFSATLPGLSPGAHIISAQATDANGFVGTAPGITVNVPITVGSIVIDRAVNATGNGSVSAPSLATSAAKETLVALVGADGSSAGETATVSGGGLSWTMVRRANGQSGDSEIWSATVPTATSGITVNASTAQPGMDLSLTVLALQNAVTGGSAAASADSGAPQVSITGTAAGAIGLGVGNDFDQAVARTPGANQTLASQWVDSATGDTYWSQYNTKPTTAAGQTVTLNDTAPTDDQWNFAAVELRPATTTAAATPDAASLDGATLLPTENRSAVGAAPTTAEPTTSAAPPTTDAAPAVPAALTVHAPASGSPVSGTVDVSADVADAAPGTSVQFTLDGLPLGAALTAAPYVTSWNTVTALPGSHTLAATKTGPDGRSVTAAPVSVTVGTRSVCIARDVNVSAHGSGAVTTPAFHTAVSGELLLAFVGYDGSPSGGQQSTVTGGGLTWKLVQRAGAGRGVAEIWSATAPSVLSNATVTATPTQPGFAGYVRVVALQGTDGLGVAAAGSGTTGPAGVHLTTTGPQSLVFAIGSASNGPAVAGSNQSISDQWTDPAAGASFWTQNTSVQAGPAGSAATIDAATSAPPGGWNLAAVEVLAADTDAYSG